MKLTTERGKKEIVMSRFLLSETISRREFVWNSLALAAFCAFGGSGDAAPSPEEGPSTHNWMLVGSQTAFLSHLPMFDHLNKAGTDYVTPHRFQVIVQASFEKNGADMTKLYFADRESHPATKMFTVSPTHDFVLPQLAATPPLSSFVGTVFRGHLERGGQPISGLADVTVRVDKVVHFHKFESKAQAPDTLEYFLFGRGKELFLAHSIVKPPDFDQILSVNVTGADLTDEQLTSAILIRIPDRKNTLSDRIKKDQQVAAELPGGDKLKIQALREFDFEEGELRMPATFHPTPEESRDWFRRLVDYRIPVGRCFFWVRALSPSSRQPAFERTTKLSLSSAR